MLLSVCAAFLLSPVPRSRPFLADGGRLAVTGEEQGVFRQGEEARPDAFDERGFIAAGKVGGAVARAEDGVADEGEAVAVGAGDCCLADVGAAVLGMAGCGREMETAGGGGGERKAVAVRQVGHARGGQGEARGREEVRREVPVGALGVFYALFPHADGERAERVADGERRADVVEVAVREQDALDGDAFLADGGEDALRLEAGVDEEGVPRRVVAVEVGVRRDGAVGLDEVEHGSLLSILWHTVSILHPSGGRKAKMDQGYKACYFATPKCLKQVQMI